MKGTRKSLGKSEREYNSGGNIILDSLARIERAAGETARRLNEGLDSVYDSLGFDPLSYQLDSKNDVWLEETEQYMMEQISKISVPVQHMQYGGKSAMESLVEDENALTFLGINLGGRKQTTEGVVEKNEEAGKIWKAVDNVFGAVEDVLFWVGRQMYKHPIAVGAVTLTGIGAAIDYKLNDGKIAKSVVDYAKNPSKIAAASGLFFGGQPPASFTNVEKIINDTVKAAPMKTARNDIKVVLGGSSDDDITPRMVNVANYLNQSQKVPNENIKVLKSSEFTYENFLKMVKEVGMNASDSDTIIIDIGSDGGKGAFAFSKEGIKYNMSDGRTMDIHYYKTIFDDIKNSTNTNAKKIIFVDACFSGSAIPIFEEVKIHNSAVITASTATALAPATSSLDGLLTGPGVPHIDYNNDGKISIYELYLSLKKEQENSYNKYMPDEPQKDRTIIQIWDPGNITDDLVLTNY